MKNSNFAIENHKNNMKIGIITAMSSEQKQLANHTSPLMAIRQTSVTIAKHSLKPESKHLLN